MSDENATPAPALGIDWLKTIAGALAAVTTAVLLSTLGAVGTLIGAALGSVAATVGSALYAQGLERGRRTVIRAQETATHAVRRPRGSVPDPAQEPIQDPEEAVEHTDRGARLRALPWKRIALLAAGTFVVVLLAITLFEQATGRSVSSYTGGSSSTQGSTVGGVTRGGNGDSSKDDDTPKPSQGPSQKASDTASASPSGSASASGTPSETPSATPSESAAPTPTPTPTPSATRTPTPTATPSATTSARPSASLTR